MAPHVIEWYEAYAGENFEVLTVHYPEFSYEKEVDNVADALDRMGIEYPVAIDNNRVAWRAWNQRYWPTTYLVDKNGEIRYKHIGEGGYEETARAIEALMAEPYDG
ncbi:MAG: redoxin domain-containing protein [Methylococcales bacterium]|nr:redoxin domain-containing protein [Methylococcales bacterium]